MLDVQAFILMSASFPRRVLSAVGNTLALPGNLLSRFAMRGLQWSPGRVQNSSVVRSMDAEFNGTRRKRAWNTSFDLQQNIEIVGWILRLRQTYVAQSSFCPRTADPGYNRELRAWYVERASKKMVDVQRRQSLDKMFVTYEGLKMLSGYALILKVRGGRLELFEAWHIARGEGVEEAEKELSKQLGRPIVVNQDGLVINEGGDNPGAIEYVAIATGNNSGSLTHRYLAHESEVIMDGFTPRSPNANTLWESPFIAAFNKCNDLLDADEFQMLKMKLHAMFSVIWLRDSQQKGGADFPVYQGTGSSAVAGSPQPSGAGAAPVQRTIPKLEVRPGSILQGEPNEKFELLESKTPSREYIEACKKFVREILSTFDIPYGFYDSEGTTYTTLRADHNRFRDAIKQPRIDLAVDKKDAIRHVMRGGIADRSMPILRTAGNNKPVYTVDNLPFNLVPDAKFMLDMGKEFPVIAAQIAAAMLDFETAAHMMGNDEFYDTVDKLADQYAYAKLKKVPITLGKFNYDFNVNDDEDEKPKKKTDDNPEDDDVVADSPEEE